MRVRIEAQLTADGAVRCELVITGPNDAEVHLPARFTEPDDEGVLKLLAGGAPFEVEVDAPLLQSVSVEAGPSGGARRLLVDDLVRAEAEAERSERAHRAATRRALGGEAADRLSLPDEDVETFGSVVDAIQARQARDARELDAAPHTHREDAAE